MRSTIVLALASACFVASPVLADTLFTTRSSSTAIVGNCPGASTNQSCNPGYVLGSGDFSPYVGTEDYQPTHFGAESASYARLLPPGGTFSYGSAISFSLTDPASDLPVLKAGAFTRPNNLGKDATSYSYISTLSAFTYDGPDALPLPLVGNIDYFITFAPINYAAPLAAGSYPFSFGQLRSRLVVGTADLFQGTALNPDALTCGSANVLASAGAFNGVGGYASGGGRQDLTMTLDVSTGCDGNPLTLQPGQQFYVYAFLEALALRGATVDATNSFHVNFLPNTPPALQQALISGISPVLSVPEPGSWAMLIIGFGLAGGALRRRRHLQAA